LSKILHCWEKQRFLESAVFYRPIYHSANHWRTNSKKSKAIHSRYRDWLQAERQSVRSSSTGRVSNFHFSISSRPALGSTQPPIQWVPWASFPGCKTVGALKQTTHLELVLRSRKRGSIHPPPHTFSCRSA
jgi:hypothetical protein